MQSSLAESRAWRALGPGLESLIFVKRSHSYWSSRRIEVSEVAWPFLSSSHGHRMDSVFMVKRVVNQSLLSAYNFRNGSGAGL
jgi:hypothetical protein